REAADFYSVKHHVAALAALAGADLGSRPLAPVTAAQPGWQVGHSTTVGDIGDGWLAHFGLLNLALVRALGIEGRVFAGMFAILPERLPTGFGARRFVEFSGFPPALRDLALVVDENVPAAEVQVQLTAAANRTAGTAFAVERVSVFDVYRGAGLPAGKKSLAFSLVFRSAERTLTDDEVNTVFQRLQEDLVATAGFQIRK
ncbi:MAG: hypothetical protein FJ399_24035, partial [Verrucomicrobia bacterium]|nr:hypothetical protein [Verrucomicrobiota bacterium]